MGASRVEATPGSRAVRLRTSSPPLQPFARMVSPTAPNVLVGQVGPTSFKFLQQPKQSRPDRAGVIAAPSLLGAWGVGERLFGRGRHRHGCLGANTVVQQYHQPSPGQD